MNPMKSTTAQIPMKSTSTTREVPMTARSPKRRRLSLKSVFVGLTRELDLLAPRYERLRPASLSRYATLPALLERITRKPGSGDANHAEVISAVLTVHQETPHRLWVAVLLRTFRPMIRHIFKKLCGSEREERLALLLTAFQEAIRKVDPYRDPLRIAMYLRQATRRGVFAALGVQRDWDAVGFGVDADETPDEKGEARAFAVEGVRDIPDLELVQTRAEHGALWDLVERQVPGTEIERLRAYHRLRRRRESLLRTLRAAPEAR